MDGGWVPLVDDVRDDHGDDALERATAAAYGVMLTRVRADLRQSWEDVGEPVRAHWRKVVKAARDVLNGGTA